MENERINDCYYLVKVTYLIRGVGLEDITYNKGQIIVATENGFNGLQFLEKIDEIPFIVVTQI